MNEELIRQYTREAYRSAYGRDIPPYNDIGKFAKELLELHHTRAVAPLKRLAADNLKLANDAAAVLRESEQDRERRKQELAAIRANVAPLVEAVIRMMKWVEPIAGDNMDPKCALEENESVMLLKQALAPFQQEGK